MVKREILDRGVLNKRPWFGVIKKRKTIDAENRPRLTAAAPDSPAWV